jgi:hypothetical protein
MSSWFQASSSVDRVRLAATRTPAAPICHPDSADYHARDDASWSESNRRIPVRSPGHMAIRAVTEMERERDASFRTGHSTNRAGSFLLPRAPVPCRRTCRGTRGNSSIHGYKKDKGKGRSQANTGGGKRRVGKKTDVTVSANQPLPVFALPTGDDHHSQLKRTDQEST